VSTRYVVRWNIPNVSNLNGTFEYVFFVKNERTDRSGNRRFEALSQDLAGTLGEPTNESSIAVSKFVNGIKKTAYSVKAPRFVQLNFNQARIGSKDKKQFLTPDSVKNFLNRISEFQNASEMFNSEETVSSVRDVLFRGRDASLKSRLSSKLNLLLNIKNFQDVEISKAIKDIGLERDDVCISLLGLNSISDLNIIDETNQTYSSTILSNAEIMAYEILFNAKRTHELTFSPEERTSFSKLEKSIVSRDLLQVMINQGSENSALDDKPYLNCLAYVEASPNVDYFDAYGAKIQGYLICKRETLSNGSALPMAVEYLEADGFTSSLMNYIDTKVVYGSTYEYSIRTVVLTRTLHVTAGESEGLQAGKYYMYSLLVSKESNPIKIEAIEKSPPSEPDGIFYNFFYSKGHGLRIRWQMPPDRQRDTKYFQVFRRRSINEPFTCIAELDFDDSEIKSYKSENVLEERIYRYERPVLNYIDTEFKRGSKYIYAISAVDAHGMSSGYSEQTEVTFNNVENRIQQKTISKMGAPKQYPNFYIRPNLVDGTQSKSLTQDAMFFSNSKNLKIYYDPDASKYESDSGTSGRIVNMFQNGVEYKLHLLNLDRQFDDVLRIRLK
jgi:hypothetical protein